MLTRLGTHGHLSVILHVLKCISHALGYLMINDSLTLGYIEYFHKVWLMYAECDLNVTRAPGVGRSKSKFAPLLVLKNLTSTFSIH